MERELFSELARRMACLADSSAAKMQFTDAQIVMVYLWAVGHDRPVSWACRAASWPLWHRRRALPSEPTMSRRLRTASVQALLDQVERDTQPAPAGSTLLIDGKPLPVGAHTKDRQARCGYAAGLLAPGYKLHLICDLNQHIHAWMIAPMNEAEPVVARELILRLTIREGWLLADSAYDSNALHEHAQRQGLLLVAPRKKPGRGLGHRPHSPARLRSVMLMETSDSPLAAELARQRDVIERFFGNLTSFGGGLSPLPAWVRTLPRVRRWVQAKLILNALRIRRRSRLCA